MNRPFLSLLFGAILIAPVLGGPSATVPVPRDAKWISHFQANVAASKKMPNIDIIFDGASINERWQTNGKPLWQQDYARLNAFDFGISGDRTQHLLWRLQQGQVDHLHPKLVFLMIGSNNLGDNSAEEIAAGLKAIVDDYRKRCPEAVIVLQGIFPRDHNPGTPNRLKIKAVNQLISKYGDSAHVLYLDFGDKFLQPDGTISNKILFDYLHPTLKGYQIWADSIQPIIDKYFPKTK
jgi:lysophospholipase L1-like esterase